METTMFTEVMIFWLESRKSVKVYADFVKPIQIRRLIIFTRMQDQVFSINLVLKYVISSEIHIRNPTAPCCTKRVHSEPDNVEPNQVLHHQIAICVGKGGQSMMQLSDSVSFFWTLTFSRAQSYFLNVI
jgi:hypothetical protein